MKMMECWEIIDKYISGLRKGFHCVPGDKRLRIITPYLYPDNDLIEVFIEDLGSGRIKVTDLGEVFRHLHSQGLDVNSSPEKKFIADTIASRVNIEISGGKLTKDATIDDVSEAMFDIITAMRGISDLIYTSRTYEPGTFFKEVKDFFVENQFKHESKVKIKGTSSKSYTVDFEILNGGKIYLHTLSARNILGIKPKVDATVRMWVDFDSELKKVSLLNDVDFQWEEPDIYILNQVSRVKLWSKKAELIPYLREGSQSERVNA